MFFQKRSISKEGRFGEIRYRNSPCRDTVHLGWARKGFFLLAQHGDEACFMPRESSWQVTRTSRTDKEAAM